MNDLAIAVFAAVSAAIGLMTANALQRARRDGAAGLNLRRLWPFFLADLALTALLVLWLLTN